jgi:hypothetical protein
VGLTPQPTRRAFLVTFKRYPKRMEAEILERTMLSKEVDTASQESENYLNDVRGLASAGRALVQESKATRGRRYDAYRHWGLNE